MREPSFWRETEDLKARRAAPVTRALLTPVSLVYRTLTRRRIRKTVPYDCGIPVICVGNLTVGGTGKTPIVAAIRAQLTQRGLRAASLSRGYKGKLKGPVRVDGAHHTATDVGDEPLMLSASGEAWIGVDRPAAAKAMVEAGVDIIIMDDGHQNPTLQKSFSLVVIHAADPFGNGFVLPKGPLREPVAEGLARADAVISMGAEEPAHIDFGALPSFRARLRPRGTAPHGRLVAFAGIGAPDKFFNSLNDAGGELIETIPFPDHHAYSKSDLSYLRKVAGERDARLITTEKDFVRLPAEEKDGILAFPVAAEIDELDGLLGLILAKIGDR